MRLPFPPDLQWKRHARRVPGSDQPYVRRRFECPLERPAIRLGSAGGCLCAKPTPALGLNLALAYFGGLRVLRRSSSSQVHFCCKAPGEGRMFESGFHRIIHSIAEDCASPTPSMDRLIVSSSTRNPKNSVRRWRSAILQNNPGRNLNIIVNCRAASDQFQHT